MLKKKISLVCAPFLLALAACSAPVADGTPPLGKNAVLDAANVELSSGDCHDALGQLKPVYNSANTDNEVRLITASAYGCDAGINYFNVVSAISGNGSGLAGPAFWNLMTQLFPSTAGDVVVESAGFATDALMAMLDPGAVVTSANLLNAGTYNPGSLAIRDRIPDSDAYLMFVSMSAIGGSQNRFGSPNPTTHKKTVALPWNTATASGITTDGCAYASAIVNFVDALGATANSTTGSISSSLKSLQQVFGAAIVAACNTGCTGATPSSGVASGCAIAAGCGNCPTALRNRNNCLGTNTDPASCAAAGIVNFINTDPNGWKGP